MSESSPSRPRQVSFAAWLIIGGSLFVLVSAFEQMAGVQSLDTRRAVQDFLAEPPADGLGVGSTLREVSGVHETAELTEAGYGQTGVFVTEGDRWLGYLFDADPESVGPKDKVVLVEVTQGTRPDLMRDGC